MRYFSLFFIILMGIFKSIFAIEPAANGCHYELSICSIFKNEVPYLKEWIEFHKLQGVEHFFLYNNNSSDNYLEILEPYVNLKQVTLIDWPYTYEPAQNRNDRVSWVKDVQRGAYNHCIQHYGKETAWLAVIDIDEFLFCVDGVSLPIFLNKYKQYGAVCVNWLLFGTSYVKDIPSNALMIETLVRCAPKYEWRNRAVRSIVQPQHVQESVTAHAFIFKEGFFAVTVDEKKMPPGQGMAPNIFHNPIRINHYWTRTETYFQDTKIASRQARRTFEDTYAMQELAKNYNDQIDTAILQFVPKLREKMGFEK
jgi:hypothetical protein